MVVLPMPGSPTIQQIRVALPITVVHSAARAAARPKNGTPASPPTVGVHRAGVLLGVLHGAGVALGVGKVFEQPQQL
ncbi:MAG: hypothetical protein L0H84_19190, partial [Pseudonocardia sp.]|nr:hypothetical protein [Pseudonocardia sp.]